MSESSPSSARRRYSSALRDEQARQTRDRILRGAATAFAARGYSGTSLADIASEAGVSVESVKAAGAKRTLLLSAFELAFAGRESDAPIAEQAELREIVAVDDTDDFLRALVRYIATANARTSGLWRSFLDAASSDATVRQALAGLLDRRRRDFAEAVSELRRRGALAESATTDAERAAVMSFVMSPESHEQLVLDSGWDQERYEAWMLATLHRLVLAV